MIVLCPSWHAGPKVDFDYEQGMDMSLSAPPAAVAALASAAAAAARTPKLVSPPLPQQDDEYVNTDGNVEQDLEYINTDERRITQPLPSYDDVSLYLRTSVPLV